MPVTTATMPIVFSLLPTPSGYTPLSSGLGRTMPGSRRDIVIDDQLSTPPVGAIAMTRAQHEGYSARAFDLKSMVKA